MILLPWASGVGFLVEMSLLDDAIREHLELMRRRGADAAEVARAEREALGGGSAEEEARLTAEAAGIIPAEPPSDPAAQETQIATPGPAPSFAPYVEDPDFGRDAAAVPLVEERPAIEANIEPDVGEIIHDAHPEPAAPAPAAELVERASQRTAAFSPEDVAAATAAHDAEAEAATVGVDPEPEAEAPVHEDSDFVYERDPEPQEEAPEPAVHELEATREHSAPAAAEPAPTDAPEEPEDVLEETPDFLQETPEHDRLWFEQRPPRDFDF